MPGFAPSTRQDVEAPSKSNKQRARSHDRDTHNTHPTHSEKQPLSAHSTHKTHPRVVHNDNVQHNSVIAANHTRPNTLPNAKDNHKLLIKPEDNTEKPEHTKWAWWIWMLIVTGVLVIVAVVVFGALIGVGTISTSSSSSKTSLDVVSVGGGGVSSSTGTITTTSSTGVAGLSNSSWEAAVPFGGSGVSAGTSAGAGGIATGTADQEDYQTCLNSAYPPVAGKTLGDGANVALDLNAFAMQGSLGFAYNMAVCTQLCCQISGCITAAYSSVPVTYQNPFNFYGCTNLQSTDNLYGASYDHCCVLRGSGTTAYDTNPTDHNYTSVFFSTQQLSCSQGTGATQPGLVYLDSSFLSGVIDLDDLTQPSLDTCFNSCAGTSGCKSVSIGPSSGSQGLSISCSGVFCCVLSTTVGPATVVSTIAGVFSVTVFPQVNGATTCSD
jgi:hypothetical protein